MTGIVLLVIAVGLVVVCLIAAFKMGSTPGRMVVKVLLVLIASILILYVAWNVVMALFVGPHMRKM